MRIGESRIGMEDPTMKVGVSRVGEARVLDSKLESDVAKRDPSDILSEKLFNSKKSLEVSALVGDIAIALVDAKDQNEQAKLKNLYEVAKRRVEDLRQSESKPKVAQKEAAPVVEETPVPQDVSDTTEQPALGVEESDEAAPAEAAEMPAEEPPVDERPDAEVLDFNAREREAPEPTLEEKLSGLQKKQEQKLNVKDRLVSSLNGEKFTFKQADPDWLEACGEVLSDNDIVPSNMADTFRSYADDMRSFGRKELRGDNLMQAVETIKRGEESINQILDIRRKAERASGSVGQSLEQKISGNIFLENDAYQDFSALLQGRDTGSRNTAVEGYWKNMQKFFSIDSKFSGAKAVVDQILTEKTYSKADNRGVNKELGRKISELKGALQERDRQQAA